MPKITVNGAELYYEEQGEGNATVVFAHSMLFNCRMFDAQIEALQDRYRCMAYDFRGQGRSQVKISPGDLDALAGLADLVVDAHEGLLPRWRTPSVLVPGGVRVHDQGIQTGGSERATITMPMAVLLWRVGEA